MAELKRHHIRFKEGPGTGGPADWEAELKKVNGVISVSIDAGKKDAFVEYDILKCCEEGIERWMAAKGFVLDGSLMERVKRGWVHYTEENERDAFTSGGHSCCDVEEIEKKKKGLEGKD